MNGFLEQLTTRNLEGAAVALRPRLLSRYEEGAATGASGPLEETQSDDSAPAAGSLQSLEPPHSRAAQPTFPTVDGTPQPISASRPTIQADSTDVKPATPAVSVWPGEASQNQADRGGNSSSEGIESFSRRLDRLDAQLRSMTPLSDSKQRTPPSRLIDSAQPPLQTERLVERHYHQVDVSRRDRARPSSEPPREPRPKLRPASPDTTDPQPPRFTQRDADPVPVSTESRLPNQPPEVAVHNESPRSLQPPSVPQVIVERIEPPREQTTVTVTIGRIEVRPPQSAAAAPPKAQRPMPRIMSLDDYVRRRQGGVG